jgi:leucyl-tRNA synthetase
MTTVVSLRHNIPYDVRIDRQTPWGNPYIMGGDGNRKMVVKKHLDWLRKWLIDRDEVIYCYGTVEMSNKWQVEHLDELVDKTIACWCVPEPCHGHNFVLLIKELGL